MSVFDIIKRLEHEKVIEPTELEVLQNLKERIERVALASPLLTPAWSRISKRELKATGMLLLSMSSIWRAALK